MYYILYISAATSWLDDKELQKILLTSRENNQQSGITGVLLYANNNFIQLLEGEQDVVTQTFEKIRQDKRHSDITVISTGNVTERCFPSWEMGFKAVAAENKQRLDDLIEQAKASFINNDCELPVRLLQSFLRKAKIDDR